MTRPLIQLAGVDVAVEGKTILRDIHWRLRTGEHWAIVGGNGSGKSTLLKLIRSELWPAPGRGRRSYAFDGGEQTTAVGIKEKIALVSPELQSRYLQQEWNLTALQVIQSGFGGGDYAYARPTTAQQQRAESILRLLGVEQFLRRNVQELSTGELRKILIARALAGAPRVLACDEVCDGLDAPSRAGLLQTLDRVSRSGTQLLYVTHRAEEMIPSITHRLELKAGRIARSSRVAAFSKRHGKVGTSRSDVPAREAAGGRTAQRAVPTSEVDAANDLRRSGPPKTLISIRGASVYLGSKPTLRDIHLDICAGEHWAVLGPNGAGKSTLLKLIAGDLHPAWGGRVRRFEFTAKNTIWEAKRKIGFISPELQSNYRDALTGADVIASGFFSSIGLMRRVSPAQRRRIAELVHQLGLEDLSNRSVLHMSYGEFRRILLARALVHRPALLICDEPFDGLDMKARAMLSCALSEIAVRGTSLLMVTHHRNDLPTCITHVAELKSGAVVFRGTLGEFAGRSGAR